MNENDKLVYKCAINDARTLLIDKAKEKLNDGKPLEAIPITRCSELLAEMKDKL